MHMRSLEPAVQDPVLKKETNKNNCCCAAACSYPAKPEQADGKEKGKNGSKQNVQADRIRMRYDRR